MLLAPAKGLRRDDKQIRQDKDPYFWGRWARTDAKIANSGVHRISGGLRRLDEKMPLAADNAPYHIYKTVNRYLESTNGKIWLLFPFQYTPQPNPTLVRWPVNINLAGRYFDTAEELNATIIKSCQIPPVKIRSLPMVGPARSARPCRFRPRTGCRTHLDGNDPHRAGA